MVIYAGQEAKARGSRDLKHQEGLETCQKAALCWWRLVIAFFPTLNYLMVSSPPSLYITCLQNLPNLITCLLSRKEVPRLDSLFFIIRFCLSWRSYIQQKFILVILPVCEDSLQITWSTKGKFADVHQCLRFEAFAVQLANDLFSLKITAKAM